MVAVVVDDDRDAVHVVREGGTLGVVRMVVGGNRPPWLRLTTLSVLMRMMKGWGYPRLRVYPVQRPHAALLQYIDLLLFLGIAVQCDST